MEFPDAGLHVTPLNEVDIWTLMYQLFLALANLHYGVKITVAGKFSCEANWTLGLGLGGRHNPEFPGLVASSFLEHRLGKSKVGAARLWRR